MKISGLDLNTSNISKIQEHGLTIAQIEKFFENDFLILHDPKHSKTESRFVGFSVVNGRNILVVFTIRAVEGVLKFRPVSCRYAHNKEVEALHEKIKARK